MASPRTSSREWPKDLPPLRVPGRNGHPQGMYDDRTPYGQFIRWFQKGQSSMKDEPIVDFAKELLKTSSVHTSATPKSKKRSGLEDPKDPKRTRISPRTVIPTMSPKFRMLTTQYLIAFRARRDRKNVRAAPSPVLDIVYIGKRIFNKSNNLFLQLVPWDDTNLDKTFDYIRFYVKMNADQKSNEYAISAKDDTVAPLTENEKEDCVWWCIVSATTLSREQVSQKNIVAQFFLEDLKNDFGKTDVLEKINTWINTIQNAMFRDIFRRVNTLMQNFENVFEFIRYKNIIETIINFKLPHVQSHFLIADEYKELETFYEPGIKNTEDLVHAFTMCLRYYLHYSIVHSIVQDGFRTTLLNNISNNLLLLQGNFPLFEQFINAYLNFVDEQNARTETEFLNSLEEIIKSPANVQTEDNTVPLATTNSTTQTELEEEPVPDRDEKEERRKRFESTLEKLLLAFETKLHEVKAEANAQRETMQTNVQEQLLSAIATARSAYSEQVETLEKSTTEQLQSIFAEIGKITTDTNRITEDVISASAKNEEQAQRMDSMLKAFSVQVNRVSDMLLALNAKQMKFDEMYDEQLRSARDEKLRITSGLEDLYGNVTSFINSVTAYSNTRINEVMKLLEEQEKRHRGVQSVNVFQTMLLIASVTKALLQRTQPRGVNETIVLHQTGPIVRPSPQARQFAIRKVKLAYFIEHLSKKERAPTKIEAAIDVFNEVEHDIQRVSPDPESVQDVSHKMDVALSAIQHVPDNTPVSTLLEWKNIIDYSFQKEDVRELKMYLSEKYSFVNKMFEWKIHHCLDYMIMEKMYNVFEIVQRYKYSEQLCLPGRIQITEDLTIIEQYLNSKSTRTLLQDINSTLHMVRDPEMVKLFNRCKRIITSVVTNVQEVHEELKKTTTTPGVLITEIEDSIQTLLEHEENNNSTSPPSSPLSPGLYSPSDPITSGWTSDSSEEQEGGSPVVRQEDLFKAPTVLTPVEDGFLPKDKPKRKELANRASDVLQKHYTDPERKRYTNTFIEEWKKRSAQLNATTK